MNFATQHNYLERVFFRSCLESSPASVAPRRPVFSAASRTGDRVHSRLHQLKQKLLHAALEEAGETGLFKRICGAANQAAELAWDTSCPLLVFPCLFEDLVQSAREQFQAAGQVSVVS
jgi:hypothetical protein